jgi:hypothetical protein
MTNMILDAIPEKKRTAMLNTILACAAAHPGLMSPLVLDHLLRGKVFGRMEEKGLLNSPHFGRLKKAAPGAVSMIISEAMLNKMLVRVGGDYPGLAVPTEWLCAMPVSWADLKIPEQPDDEILF